MSIYAVSYFSLRSPSLSLSSPNVAPPNTPAVPATFATIVCSFSAGRIVLYASYSSHSGIHTHSELKKNK